MCHGEIYNARKDPRYRKDQIMDLYAPDIVQSNDGKFYLYYNLTDPERGMNGFCSVAVADRVEGPYVYHGMVQNPDGTPYNTYLMGANAFELEDDMLTIRSGAHRIVAGQFDTPRDSSFFGHAFYEASSIRKINGLYYFIYSSSSENSNELCYATSQYPDKDFVCGGTIISNGDVGYQGLAKEKRNNMTASPVRVGIRVRGEGEGAYLLSTDEAGTEEIGRIAVGPSQEWVEFETEIDVTGEKALYLRYNGNGFSELLEVRFF